MRAYARCLRPPSSLSSQRATTGPETREDRDEHPCPLRHRGTPRQLGHGLARDPLVHLRERGLDAQRHALPARGRGARPAPAGCRRHRRLDLGAGADARHLRPRDGRAWLRRRDLRLPWLGPLGRPAGPSPLPRGSAGQDQRPARRLRGRGKPARGGPRPDLRPRHLRLGRLHGRRHDSQPAREGCGPCGPLAPGRRAGRGGVRGRRRSRGPCARSRPTPWPPRAVSSSRPPETWVPRAS
jgi:hypothetical protein